MSDPLIIGFDTSGPHVAATLSQGQQLLASRREDMARGQAERLMPLLSELLSDHNLGWRDLDAIGVGTGPGNFTGIRISVAAARGLALGLGIPACGITGFAALYHGRQDAALVSIAAPRGQIYVQAFEGTALGAPMLAQPDALPGGDLQGASVQVGAAGTPQINGLPQAAPALDLTEAIAQIASTQFEWANQPPTPCYVKPPDAAPARDKAPVITR